MNHSSQSAILSPHLSDSSPRKSADQDIVRWLKFNLVGGIGLAIQLGALAFFSSVLQMNYLLATALAVETAVIHNFLWHQRFTWSDRPATSPSHFPPSHCSPLHFFPTRLCLPERSGVSKARPAQSKDPYVLLLTLARFIKFNATNGAVSLAGNLLIMRALVGQWHINYAIANLIAVATCSLINFLLSDRLVFQRAAKS